MTASHNDKIRNLEDFAEIASDWFWETDADHRFTYFSNRLEDVTGISTTAMIGKRRDTIPAEDASEPKWINHMADLVAHRPFRNFEYMILRPTDQQPVWMRIAGQPQFDKNGNFLGYLGTGTDISAEMVATQRLEASNAKLAERNRELDDARRALEQTAYEDALTGLSNRRAFERDLEEALAVHDGNIGLLHIDLDRFKWVNDTLGHPAGDHVLMITAERLLAVMAEQGSIYRLGGDEFAGILTTNVSCALANWIGDSIVDAVSAPMDVSKRKVHVGASVGFAIAKCSETSARRLISHADVALYEAKRGGRNTVRQITPEVQAHFEDQRKLAGQIAGGLDRMEFVPFFQPQVHVETNTIIGAEALVRWQHPERGLLPPGAFLQAAADLGLSAQIDKVILDAALAAVGRLAYAGFHLPSVSVNVSEARLLDPSLCDDVKKLWTDRRCRLSIELLETIYFDDTHHGHQFDDNLGRLRKMGVGIETDDFGSGRASITGLLRTSPDRLKIDRSLVQAVVADPTKRSLVSAILDMTRALGIESIAEGVETQADIDALQRIGCQMFQGYAISYPLSEADFLTYLASQSGPDFATRAPKRKRQT